MMKTDLNMPPHEIRAANAKKQATFDKILEEKKRAVHEVQDIKISVREGQAIPGRLYRPSAVDGLPLIIYFHGGGFVLRSIESHDGVCRRLCDINQAVVFSVGYRLAPEYKFPIPHQDCYDATVWATDHIESLGADIDRVTVAGDSAGANLATVVSIMARDFDGPTIQKQVLLYPCCDSSKNYPSEIEFSDGYFLSKERMDWFTDHYINRPEELYDPLISPLLTADLSGLPSAYLCTAGYDPLKSEGAAYAERLSAAGNDVVYQDYQNTVHGFFNMPNICKEAYEANENIRQFLGYR